MTRALQAAPSPKESTLFVFYELTQEAQWSYARMPKGWRWVGAGLAQPVKRTEPVKRMEPVGAQATAKYPREEQFMGPVETKEVMKNYLEQQFSKLKKKHWISRYKIRSSYLP